MKRVAAAVCAVLALILFAGLGLAADKNNKNGNKNQMVRGTIKTVDVSKNLLVVNQKVKKDVVERQLDIRGDTEFEIVAGDDKQTASGADGLKLLEGKEGATVAVKCDKDVNVLKVTVRLRKK